MSWSFNPFTGNLDLVGGGAVVFEGEVETFADLPETVGDPAVGASYLVRTSTGVWLVNRRQAGIWIRRNNTGVRATDWEYGGDYPVNSVNGQTGNVSLGSSDVSAEPIDYTVVTSATTLANGAKVAANTTAGAFTLTLPATPANGDTVSILDYAGTFDTNNLTIARNGSNIESLAEDMDCNIEDAAFSLVYVGSTVGWKVVPYFGNKTNFASPDPIGSSVANTGRFTTLTAGNGTITASAPVLDLSQTWNNAAVTFTGLRFNVTNTASAAASLLADFQVGGTTQFAIRRNGSINVPSQISLTLAGQATPIEFDGSGTPAPSVVANQFIANGDVMLTGGRFGTGNVIIRTAGASSAVEVRGTTLTTPQAFRLYNTTDAGLTNFERGFMRWSSNVLQIGTEKGGTGSARNVQLQRDGTTFLTLESTSAQAFNSWVFFGTVFANGGITMTGSGNPLVISGSNNIVEQRNGANSQTFRLFNTHTSSTSFECLNIAAQSAGSFIIGTEKGSVGGTARGLELRTDNTARLTFGASGTITLNTTLAADAQNISTDTTTGTKIGTGTTQKIGFFNATPVVQQAAVADATDAASTQARLNDLLARLRTLGLIAT